MSDVTALDYREAAEDVDDLRLEALLLAAAEEHERGEAARAWQSIDTAPKDGTVQLCYDAIYGLQPRLASYQTDAATGWTGWWCDGASAHPTHWLPMRPFPRPTV